MKAHLKTLQLQITKDVTQSSKKNIIETYRFKINKYLESVTDKSRGNVAREISMCHLEYLIG